MWQWFMDVLPDVHAGSFEARDLLSLVMTGLGAYLAWQAIKVGREQVASARRQETLSEQMKVVTEEQAGIAREQAAIARAQHEVMQRQLAQRSRLEVVCDPEDEDQSSKDNCYVIPVYVRNDGRITAAEFTWFIFGDFESATDGEPVNMSKWPGVGLGRSGHYAKPISANQFRLITKLRVRRDFVLREGGVRMAWYIDTPSTRFPEDAEYGYETFTKARFKRDDT